MAKVLAFAFLLSAITATLLVGQRHDVSRGIESTSVDLSSAGLNRTFNDRKVVWASAINGTENDSYIVVLQPIADRGGGIAPSIAMVRRGQVMRQVDLSSIDEYADMFSFLKARTVNPVPIVKTIAVAFEGASNSARLFVVVVAKGDEWEVELVRRTTQGQIRLREGGRLIEVRNAAQQTECNICPHQYRSTLFALDETKGRYLERPGTLDLGVLDPKLLLQQPIVVLE